MAITDWTCITDGTNYITPSQECFIDYQYACKIKNTYGTNNYVTLNYHNNPNYSSLDNVRIEGILAKPTDYFNVSSNYLSAPNFTATAVYSVSNNTITKGSDQLSGWSNSIVANQYISSSNLVNGVGVKFKINRQSNIMVALSTESTSVAYSSLDYAIYVNYGIDLSLGRSTNAVTIYENNAISYGTYSNSTDGSVYPAGGYDYMMANLDDILSIEVINKKINYRINGKTFYTNTTAVASNLYVHVCIHTPGASVDVSINNANNIDYAPICSPLLFCRLQDTTVDSSCYALMHDKDSVYLTKGSLNTATPTILSTLQMNYPWGGSKKFALETINLSPSTVQLKAYTWTYNKFDNDIAVSTNGSDIAKRNALQATTNEVTISSNGRFGKAANFSGNSALKVDLSTNSVAHTDGYKYVEFWFNARNVNSGCLFMFPCVSTAGSYGATKFTTGMVNLDNGYLTLMVAGHYAHGIWSVKPSTPISPNTWYQCAFVYSYPNSTTVSTTLYLNGSSLGTVTQAYSISYGWGAQSGYVNMYIGCNYDTGTGRISNFYDGLMDSFYFVYGSSAITPSVISTRYASQAGGQDTQKVTGYDSSSFLYRFEDSPTQVDMLTYTDSVNPLSGGKTGFGVYNRTRNTGASYVDSIKLYTEI